MPFTPWFPEPGSYIKYFDKDTQAYKYRRLLWRRDPLKYVYRFASFAVTTSGTTKTFDEINPSEKKSHIYLAYVGVCPGFLFALWHPYDVKNLKWDETIEDIDDDKVANLSYDESPMEFPTKCIGIDHDRYPAIQPTKNLTGETKSAEISIIAAMYKVKEHTELSQDEVAKLNSGALRSYPWDFGGEL